MFSPLVRHSFSKLQAREARREALDQRMSDEQVLKAREVVVLCLHPTGLFRPFYSESLLHEHGSAVFLFFFKWEAFPTSCCWIVVASVLKKTCHLFGFSEKKHETHDAIFIILHFPRFASMGLARHYPEISGDVSPRGSFVESIPPFLKAIWFGEVYQFTPFRKLAAFGYWTNPNCIDIEYWNYEFVCHIYGLMVVLLMVQKSSWCW